MQKISPEDAGFMRRALDLARGAAHRVHPNPYVGAVVVKDGRVVGEGRHEKYGDAHAEAVALRAAGSAARGATLYVTLEPCPHFGKTPPCADLAVSCGVSRVVVAASDPNRLVAGKGLRRLRAAGVRVEEGVLAEEAADLNRDFNHWIVRKTPYAALKTAQSLDGRIATRTGDSKWITGKEARHFGHSLRASADAVLVGVTTVLADDPRLDARLSGNRRQPIKVVVDSSLRTPPGARLFRGDAPVILAVTRKAPAARVARFKGRAAVLVVKDRGGRVDLDALFRELGARGVVRLLIEGGGEVAAEALERGLVRETYTFIAPKIIGGRDAVPAVGGTGARKVRNARAVKDLEIVRLGDDVLLWGRL